MNRPVRLISILLSTSLLLGLVTLFVLFQASQTSSWQLWILVISFGSAFIASILLIPSVYLKEEIKIYLILVILHLAFGFWAAVVSGTGWILGLSAIFYTSLVVNATLKNQRVDIVVTISIFGSVLISLVGVILPIKQIDNIWLQILAYVLLIANSLLFALRVFPSTNLRTKITSAVLIIVLLPLIIQSIVQNRFIQQSITQQTFDSLKLVASQTATKIDDFITTNQETISKDSALSVFNEYLSVPENQRAGSQQEKDLMLTVEALRRRQQAFLTSYALLDENGEVVFDTVPSQIGSYEASQDHFLLPMRSGQIYVSSIQFPSWNTDPYIYFSSPVKNADNKTIGVLRLRYSGKIFQRLLEQNINLLGLRSYPILLDENYIRLADTITPSMIFRSLTPLPPEKIIALRRERRIPFFTDEGLSTELYDLVEQIQTYQQDPFFTTEFHQDEAYHIEAGAIVPLQTKPWYILYVQEQAILGQLLTEQNKVFVVVATIIAGILGMFAATISRIVSRPITLLTDTAEKISAGDLEAKANVTSRDELGALSDTFNLMTSRLRNSISELESRVQERTKELADQNQFLLYSSQQLQTLADVARSIASVRDLDQLLDQVTVLVSERFGFYHVGIFLTDDSGFAVLRAANSPGGKRMLARQHKLKVGQVGIVGYVTDRGEPRIATDVGQDAVFFNNPDLPDTRSEMSLPLKAGNDVIGALDVQSKESNAFSPGDISLFSTLADQIAIAIVNNRLYAETNRALDEARSLHRQYLRQEWGRLTAERSANSYVYTTGAVTQRAPSMTDEINTVLETGQISLQQGVIVPIALRGETIGVIQIQDTPSKNLPGGEQKRIWSSDEISAVQSVADQVGQALENARLFEQTVRRAERERRVLDITSKIRSTNSAQEMIEIALQELQKTLNVSRAQIILQEQSNTETNLDQDQPNSQISDNALSEETRSGQDGIEFISGQEE